MSRSFPCNPIVFVFYIYFTAHFLSTTKSLNIFLRFAIKKRLSVSTDAARFSDQKSFDWATGCHSRRIRPCGFASMLFSMFANIPANLHNATTISTYCQIKREMPLSLLAGNYIMRYI
jgi:hypothetical protein